MSISSNTASSSSGVNFVFSMIFIAYFLLSFRFKPSFTVPNDPLPSCSPRTKHSAKPSVDSNYKLGSVTLKS